MSVQKVDGPAVWQGAHNKESSIRSFARACFQYAIDTKQDLWFSTKDTIAKIYDGEFKRVFEEEFETTTRRSLSELGITYFYTLIDDAVARVIRSRGRLHLGLQELRRRCDERHGLHRLRQPCHDDLRAGRARTAPPSMRPPTAPSPSTTTSYLKGEKTSTNPMATIFAWTGALRKRGQLDGLHDLEQFAGQLEEACFDHPEPGAQ